MRRGTADTGASFEFIPLACGRLQRYGGERLTDYATSGGGTLSLHWSTGEEGVFSLGGVDLPIQPGGVAIMRPDDRYELHKGASRSLKVARLVLNLDAAPALRIFLPDSPIARLCARLHKADIDEAEEIALQIEAWVRQEDGRAPQREAPCPQAVRLAADLMLSDLAAPHRLSDLAQAAGLSVNHLIRSFRVEHGASPHAWLKEQRLLQARRILSTRTVAETAHAVGWESPASFSLAFSRRFGIAPSTLVTLNKRLGSS